MLDGQLFGHRAHVDPFGASHLLSFIDIHLPSLKPVTSDICWRMVDSIIPEPQLADSHSLVRHSLDIAHCLVSCLSSPTHQHGAGQGAANFAS
jgi:hypothetical protein